MPAKSTATILVALFLFAPFFCSATTYYVNVSNATPSTGTSWATAFTDFNQALAAATGPFDQIWVAQGTYYPTATTDRTISFAITNGISIYGGFNGTETAYTQANPAAYPTILSGDIGVPGDASDNSYHVVTFTNPGGANLTFDGFTITGGNANLGYPASTVPSISNTGGGFLEYETGGPLVSAAITHCTFTSNFAVYGGGFGAIGDASMTPYTLLYCHFNNNTAFAGGGVASIGTNNEYSVAYIDMCVFVNDNSLNAQGSAIATLNTNATSNPMLTTVTNNVMYNDPQPQLYNLSTSAPGSSLQLYCSIIWNSGAPYNGPLTAGNSLVVSMCDLDLATPDGSDLDVDPQFTNAAGGDFHTPKCGPLVDQGFTTDGFNMGKTDPDGNPRLLGPKTDIGLYESQMPAAPTATSPTYCVGAIAVPLTATGSNLLWYTLATGGTGVPAAPTPSTASADVVIYYVTQTLTGGCESTRTPVTVTVNAGAAAPTATSMSYCIGSSATPLSATGANLLWYTSAAGGTGDPAAPTPSTSSAGIENYYVTQTPAGSCESARTPVTVTIASPAAAPTAVAVNYCEGAIAVPLTATGDNLQWYTAATGAGSATAPTPSTMIAGVVNYYVTQTPTGFCESAPATVAVTVDPTPGADFTWSNACAGAASTISATSASAGTYTWDFGGAAYYTGTAAGPYQVTWTSGGSYTVTLTAADGACQAQTQYQVQVYANPTVGILATPASLCPGSSVPLLASGAATYQWYPATGLSDPTSPDPVALLQNTIQYTVTGTDANGCTATAQIAFDISPNCMAYAVPDAFSPNGDGHNDIFRVIAVDNPKSFSLVVFNRYGQKVYGSGNLSDGWDGTIQGSPAPEGAYVYVMQAVTSAGVTLKKQGTVLLVR